MLVGTAIQAPYGIGLSGLSACGYTAPSRWGLPAPAVNSLYGAPAGTAVATDTLDNSATSDAVTVTVVNNTAPAVTVTATPTNVQVPAVVVLGATTADIDGSIAKVEFLRHKIRTLRTSQNAYILLLRLSFDAGA